MNQKFPRKFQHFILQA